MANVTTYVQKSEEDSTGFSSIVKVLGNTKTITSGWSTWAIKTFSVSFASAVVFGCSCQMALAPTSLGPILPFLIGSSSGFISAMVHRWHFDTREALHAVQEFPDIMEHHLMLLGPSQWEGVDMEEWKKDLRRNPRKLSMAIVALYSASDVIARIREQREEQLIRQYTAQYSE